MKEKKIYPFTAIVGQEMMKKALILNLVNPLLGGVLIRGEKGTAKSTAVRALAELMLERRQVEDCLFNCDPDDISSLCDDCAAKTEAGEEFGVITAPMRVVDLPVSATEDRVVGSLDIEQAIKKGEKSFEPGILARANRNILYVDEVNLLDDHVVDVLLDSVAMGTNTVEREGVSISHPARLTLVGTMNPEEGDLRPQLLDRFGMVTDVVGEREVDDRTEVIKRRLEYERDPDAFAAAYEPQQQIVRESVMNAIAILPEVVIDNETVNTAARIAIELQVDGHRADITMVKTAATLAALGGRTNITKADLREAAVLALPHRMRRRPFEEGKLDFSIVDAILQDETQHA
ncbi:MAG: AAA family ATPase [Eubacteriaceae bacterium]|nr:AAA family ATPase [Eubacteriaceae bacterium]